MSQPISFHINSSDSESEKVLSRQDKLKAATGLAGENLFVTPFPVEQVGTKNCENLIGSVPIPVGVAGPVKIKSELLSEEVIIPLATTEGALLASVNRGCRALYQVGEVQVYSKKIGMSRAPVFECENGQQAQEFVKWIDDNVELVAQLCEETSHHLKYLSHSSYVRGCYVFVRFVFDTDQAMGMNMVSIALAKAWEKLHDLDAYRSFKNVEILSLSSNVCTDKKDSVINRLLGRGYWVQAEVNITSQDISELLKTDVDQLIKVHQVKNLIGSNVAGSLSQNMQVANVVSALYLATGQDPAHVVEASQASTTIKKTKSGLYISVTLPNLNLGVVGGGTYLPAQSEARQLIRFGQDISAQQLAEVTGAAVLAGELSGLSALASNTLAQAHKQLAREKRGKNAN